MAVTLGVGGNDVQAVSDSGCFESGEPENGVLKGQVLP